MTTYSFLDDYSEGCHPEIVAALADTNLAQQTAYGNDDYSIEAHRLMANECGDPDLPVHFVSGGTLANLIIAAATLRSHEAMISASSGHVAARETGAIEATGHKIITMPSADGKLTAADVEGALAANAQYPHMAKPRLVYVSNATELGTVYTPDELHALRAVCTQNDLLLMIDGARLGVALASERAQGMSLADIAAVADIFWVGGTKAGTLFGEAIVIANPALATDFDYHLKQRGALLAKGRALGLQFQTLFGPDDLFRRAAVTANDAARVLAEGITGAGHPLAAATESNQVFPVLPNPLIAALQEQFRFYLWEERADDRSVVRLVTSWATDQAQVERFVDLVVSA
ncbi:MAG: aminotransferase class I/II-fold pyridoxal phosphate-dependent enzyme [Actinomycetia bacterium]|nr:aminotransferase class I/II-fold pyridoxal phosphate-dependent enzyme [Actinomycetes bacterium]MCP3912016.1 aminotransferase class I/II-fold pyridoxal phosphate-dependent enzyme [Actinomycetes bacterium]MCP4084125.1 aminotransferase class I/II-fold pyridoxal phosphate-dependent enzyme [Actinomycetes bacterium]